MTDAELTAAAITGVQEELGRTLTNVEQVQATRRVKNALVVIRDRLGQALAGVSDDALIYVLSEMLLARFSNPEGYQSESIDDYTYRHGSETRRATILPEWWALLTPTVESSASSTRPGFAPDVAPVDWNWT